MDTTPGGRGRLAADSDDDRCHNCRQLIDSHASATRAPEFVVSDIIDENARIGEGWQDANKLICIDLQGLQRSSNLSD